MAQLTEIGVRPFFEQQPINCPDPILKQQPEEKIATRGCPNLPNCFGEGREDASSLELYLVG
jgi:hypothetical protein